MISYLHILAKYLKPLLPDPVKALQPPLLSSLRAIYLYETPWTFLKHYPFPDDAYFMLDQFINEFEQQPLDGFDAWILPYLNEFENLIKSEYTMNVANSLSFNAKSGKLKQESSYSILPAQLLENSERLFYLFNLNLLANKIGTSFLWSDTLEQGNLFLDRAPCLKRSEAAKRVYNTKTIRQRFGGHTGK